MISTHLWLGCLLLVLTVHTMGLALLFRGQPVDKMTASLAHAVILDMVTDFPIAPQRDEVSPQNQQPPKAKQKEVSSQALPQQKPERTVNTPPDKALKKVVEKKQKAPVEALPQDRPQKQRPDHPQSDEVSPQTAASLAARSNALSNWKGLISAHLARHKYYPRMARVRHQEGIVTVRIIVSRTGSVLSVSLDQTSGFQSLDQEALNLPKRANPLPPPPQHMDAPAPITVPITFQLT